MTNDPVAAYLSRFTGETLARINHTRQIVTDEAPRFDEGMSYGLIGWKLNGRPLIYVGGFTAHIGLYATPSGHEHFAKQFARYKQGKGSVQFPLDQAFPAELVREVVRYRVAQVADQLPSIGAPAKSALESAGVTRMQDLHGRTEADLLKLHGVGPKAVRILRDAGADL